MNSLDHRRFPFALAAGILLIAGVAAWRLPDSFVAQLERNRGFSASQAAWALRLLAVAAIAQAAYGGFVVLRAERIQQMRSKDPKLAQKSHDELAASIARNAVGMTLLTLVYAAAAFFVTGQRGGLWLFAVIFVAQGAWYYRQTGEIFSWMRFQPEQTQPRTGAWEREPPDYCPPLARGMGPPGDRPAAE